MNPNKPVCRQNNCQQECTPLALCPGEKSCVDGRYIYFYLKLLPTHSMANDNFNKSKETMPTTSAAL